MPPTIPPYNAHNDQKKRQAQAAGKLADNIAANPIGQQVKANPQRIANQQRRQRTLDDLRGTQAALASPTFGQPKSPARQLDALGDTAPAVRTLNEFANPQHAAGPQLLAAPAAPAPAMVPGQMADVQAVLEPDFASSMLSTIYDVTMLTHE